MCQRKIEIVVKHAVALMGFGTLLIRIGLIACLLPLTLNGCAGSISRCKVRCLGIVNRGAAFEVTLTEKEVTVKNIYNDTVAIRISWDRKDPHALGRGQGSVIYSAVFTDATVSAELKNHSTVQVWAWDKEGKLIDQCDVELCCDP